MEIVNLPIQTPVQLKELEKALSARAHDLKGEIISNQANVNPQLNAVLDMLAQVRFQVDKK